MQQLNEINHQNQILHEHQLHHLLKEQNIINGILKGNYYGLSLCTLFVFDRIHCK